jgi:hypothetical protein
MSLSPRRSRPAYAAAIVVAVWLGIASRHYGAFLPDLLADYAGDTLWALAVFATIGLVFPSIPTWVSASGAYVISALVEFSQLYHAPWIDSIRGTPLGALALGTDFVSTDLACYAAGVALGLLIELWTLS